MKLALKQLRAVHVIMMSITEPEVPTTEAVSFPAGSAIRDPSSFARPPSMDDVNPYHSPVCSATPAIKQSASQVHFGALGFVICLFTVALLSCACGHLDWIALPGTALGAILSWLNFIRGKDTPLYHRIGEIGSVIFTTLFLLKNLHDVLWSGHEPFFH